MVDRRRFLQDSMLAAAGLALVPSARDGRQGVRPDDAPRDGVLHDAARHDGAVTFDLHTHPGAFFRKGTPEFTGDSAIARSIGSMRSGKLTGAFFSVVSDGPLIQLGATGVTVRGQYARGEGAREYERQLALLKALPAQHPAFIATAAIDLPRALRLGKTAAYIACEGGECLDGSVERVDQLHADGVRSIQIVHYVPSALGDLQTQPAQHGGLSALGKDVVRRMNKAGMLIDVAHAALDTVKDVVSLTTQPIMLSHSLLKMEPDRLLAARAITPEHAKLVAGTGGVIGMWPSGFNKGFEEFVDNTKRLVDVVGVDHVGLGTDMDGNLRPVFDAYWQLAPWAAGLRARGFGDEDVEKILGGNVQRMLKQVIG
ncbi:MAG: membrane dipeptidase [Gemmatimonadetes bacterium]|nr:membrane dipeptidase [Gemmatimonadota bacterium]